MVWCVPRDYVKSIWALGLIEIFIYTLTGALVYAFVGSEVKSPAILSAAPLVSKVAFGIALPVIFISGSINSTVSPSPAPLHPPRTIQRRSKG